MGRYFRRRLLTAIPVFFGITFLVFVLLSLSPADVTDLGEGASGGAQQAALDEGGLRQKEKSLCDHGISVRLAEEQDVKRLLVSYYLHDADPESLEDVDGERVVFHG